MSNNSTHLRRVRRTRKKILNQGSTYMVVHRTPKHIYAQVYSALGKVLASASSLEAAVRKLNLGPGKLKVAEMVGKLVAERAKENGVSKIAFDRSGYKFHGRVKALADGARGEGLVF